jgi:hypothetical protein
MTLVNIPDHLYRRLEAFVPVARAVMNEHVDVNTVVEIVVDAGLRGSLNAIVQPQEERVLVQALQQLASADPELVYGHTADMVALGADMRAQMEAHGCIGFRHQGIRAE